MFSVVVVVARNTLLYVIALLSTPPFAFPVFWWYQWWCNPQSAIRNPTQQGHSIAAAGVSQLVEGIGTRSTRKASYRGVVAAW